MIPKSQLNQYRREVDSASDDARRYLTAVSKAYLAVNPNASVADVRNYAINAIQDGLQVYGDQARLISNEFFDTLAAQSGSKATAEMFDTISDEWIEDKVRYYAGSIAAGDTSKFIKDVSNLTGYYVKREAFQNMLQNCKKSGIRYARVPSGRETCAFCFMLASRGFVYWTEADAGASGHEYHAHCDCVIVPGFFNGGSLYASDNQVEGYKPSELYGRYRECYEQAKKDAGQTPSAEDVIAEIKKRDTRWLWTGEKHDLDN